VTQERPRRPTLHDFQIGELVTLVAPVKPFGPGTLVQIAGFRGEKQLRLLPIGGIPVVAHFSLVARTGLPCGSSEPPRRFRRRRRPARAAA
jgi:hypothetical protein